MKKLIYLCCLPLLLIYGSCKKEKLTFHKDGVSLPVVTDLALQKTGDKTVKITWGIPGNIPDEIQQPLSVNVEVNEIIGVTKAVSVSTVTLANAPLEYVYELPDPSKKYLITVKLMGSTKTVDVNYSSNIYSLGQTVAYN